MNLTGILEVNILGKKIFVSYKYADEQVENLVMGENSTVRDYVDEFEKSWIRLIMFIKEKVMGKI